MADVAARLRASAAALRGDGPAPGRAWCRAWTDEVDAALRELRDGVTLPARGGRPARFAVVAVGGYGRRELCPGSDLDLLLLVDGLDDDAQAAAVRELVYPLWDAGLTVGHAVRGPEHAVQAARDDLDAATAAVDARLVAGDAEPLRQARDALSAWLRRRPDRFLDQLAAADRARRERYGDTAEMLEPNLRDGAGGLRDVQSLRWAAAALLGAPELDALVGSHYLAAFDRTRLARAYERLLAVRVALHLQVGRRSDVLTFDQQDAVARRLGADGAQELLHDVFLAGRVIDHVHRSAWALLTADARRVGVRGRLARRLHRPAGAALSDGLSVTDDVVVLDRGHAVDDPSLPTVLLQALATTGATLDRHSAERVARGVPAAPQRWHPADLRRFLDVLWTGSAALPALFEFDDLGLLAALVPEWAPLRGRPQRNPLHRFALDRHALHAAAELADLVRREPWARARLDEVEDRDGLMLGVLLHDVGKAVGEPHSETGVAVAEAIAERLAVGPATRRLVGTMVRLHLLLPDTATRRDLADPGLVEEVAVTVGDRQTLACLHLLAAADGRATGPSTWSAWKATLVAELVTKVAAVLDATAPDDRAGGPARTVEEAIEVAASMGVDADTVRAHVAQLPERYAASVSPRAIVRHAAAAAEVLDATEVRTRVTPGDEQVARGVVDDLDLVALDRPGLFAKVAGVLALRGGSVLGAAAFTRDDGVAVDTFKVRRPADEDARAGSWWAAVEGDLVDAVAGKLALRARLARQAAARRTVARPGPVTSARVEVADDVSGQATVVEVHADDAPGLLYRIAAALAELELDIVAARIDTLGHEAIDVFYVRDADGAPLDDDHAAEVVLALSAALEA